MVIVSSLAGPSGMHHRDAVRRGPRTSPDAVTSEQCKQLMHRRDSSAFNPPSVPELLFSDDRSTRCNPPLEPTCCNRFWPCAALPSSGFALSLSPFSSSSSSLSLSLPLFQQPAKICPDSEAGGEERTQLRDWTNADQQLTRRDRISRNPTGNPLPYFVAPSPFQRDVEYPSWRVITPRVRPRIRRDCRNSYNRGVLHVSSRSGSRFSTRCARNLRGCGEQ